MNKYGIDKLSFYIPRYKLDQSLLATSRKISEDKIKKGLGQIEMAVIPPWEDVITMGCSAAMQLLTRDELNSIDCILFATETGMDYSKAGSVVLHELLKLPSRCRAVEIKQACYAGTFALHSAISLVSSGIHKNVLVICSDVARYGFHSTGESSQGAGAVAMLIKQDPRFAVVNTNAAFITKDVYDFWRPHGHSEAIVDGRFSCQMYLELLSDVYNQYKTLNPSKALHTMCFHLPVPRLVEKAYAQMSCHMIEDTGAALSDQLSYSKLIGNCYTASLYLGLISLVESSKIDLSNKTLGLYSYGSGATCDFFDITLTEKVNQTLHKQLHQNLIQNRIPLLIDQYEDFYQRSVQGNTQGEYGYCALEAIENNRRVYKLRSVGWSYQEHARSGQQVAL